MSGNRFRTALLLGMLTGLFLLIGSLIGGKQGLIIGLGIAVFFNFISFWFSAKIVLAMYRAKEADHTKYSKVYFLLRELIGQVKMPLPKLYVITSPHPNAFATGRSKKQAVIAVTSGLVRLLNDNELKGVLAHELAHIKNRDILISTLAATIAGVISYIAMMARWAAIFGGVGGRNDQGKNGFLELLVLAVIAPLMAVIIKLAISRSREYLADETGVKMTRDPFSLVSALKKIHQETNLYPLPKMGKTEATAHLFIHNPFKGTKGAFINLFSTHPPFQKRIKRLQAMQLR